VAKVWGDGRGSHVPKGRRGWVFSIKGQAYVVPGPDSWEKRKERGRGGIFRIGSRLRKGLSTSRPKLKNARGGAAARERLAALRSENHTPERRRCQRRASNRTMEAGEGKEGHEGWDRSTAGESDGIKNQCGVRTSRWRRASPRGDGTKGS